MMRKAKYSRDAVIQIVERMTGLTCEHTLSSTPDWQELCILTPKQQIVGSVCVESNDGRLLAFYPGKMNVLDQLSEVRDAIDTYLTSIEAV
jgi:hypothetical protein